MLTWKCQIFYANSSLIEAFPSIEPFTSKLSGFHEKIIIVKGFPHKCGDFYLINIFFSISYVKLRKFVGIWNHFGLEYEKNVNFICWGLEWRMLCSGWMHFSLKMFLWKRPKRILEGKKTIFSPLSL